MSFFQKTQDWLKSKSCKRILISCPEELNEDALSFCFSSNKLADSDSVFCLDIHRSSSEESIQVLNDCESFIFQPSSWEEIIQSVQEVADYTQIKSEEGLFSKTTLILNNWQVATYLFTSSQGLNGINPNEFLTELRFLSDKVNIILLNSIGSSQRLATKQQSRHHLSSWAHLALNMLEQDKLEVVKSAFLDWPIGKEIQLAKSKLSLVSHNQKKEINSQKYEVNSIENLSFGDFSNSQNDREINTSTDESKVSIKNIAYDQLVSRLSNAENKQQLLDVRQEIQSLSERLSSAEKVALSDIYKINLNRIKLIEEASLEVS
ncbi:MAG: hypothetical protein QNJ31_00860 [Candidatus Caenarcaniphilales bacterium]|nr:hypothetical protein [Candidatus Caenarcaniphilales bacterium]